MRGAMPTHLGANPRNHVKHLLHTQFLPGKFLLLLIIIIDKILIYYIIYYYYIVHYY
jgi:hypothetical protein